MRGEDITKEQLDAADRFLTRVEKQRSEVALVKRADIIRLLAWYAAVRLEGAEKGCAGDDGEVVE